jgi:hypothetical protein
VNVNNYKKLVNETLNKINEKINFKSPHALRVTRSNIWKSTLGTLPRAGFDHSKVLRIIFLDSELAIDAGGPLREYSRLLIDDLKNKSGLFEGVFESNIMKNCVYKLYFFFFF